MPYVTPELRGEMDGILDMLARELDSHGCLNYAITRLCLSMNPKRYEDYNALIGVLECAKLELYRRAVAPYEDGAIRRNGDIPEYAERGGE